MTLFGRDTKTYARNIRNLPLFLLYFARCFATFKHPLAVLRCYFNMTPPASNMLHLRNGWKLHLSNDASDVVTAFQVFAKRDYGTIPKSGTVIDIGANIGLFSLYAALHGADRVLAFEPSEHSFALLKRNVDENGLSGRVNISRLAISATGGTLVQFPRKSNVLNKMVEHTGDESGEDHDLVATASLSEIVANAGRVGLLKIDCEGAEYDILYSTTAGTFQQIHQVRMEYHKGGALRLQEFLRQFGFRTKRMFKEFNGVGGLWLERGA
jgi:FkbM family methyltransferase